MPIVRRCASDPNDMTPDSQFHMHEVWRADGSKVPYVGRIVRDDNGLLVERIAVTAEGRPRSLGLDFVLECEYIPGAKVVCLCQ